MAVHQPILQHPLLLQRQRTLVSALWGTANLEVGGTCWLEQGFMGRVGRDLCGVSLQFSKPFSTHSLI